MLIGLSGYAGSGKDSVANILVKRYSYTRKAFADKLKDFAVSLDPIIVDDGARRLSEMIEEYGTFEAAKRNAPGIRLMLQELGTAARENLGDDIWVDQVLPVDSRYEHHARTAITDVRYPNEVDAIHDMFGCVVRVSRPGYGPVNDHASEQEVEYDHVIENNGTLKDLEYSVDLLMHCF